MTAYAIVVMTRARVSSRETIVVAACTARAWSASQDDACASIVAAERQSVIMA